MKIGKKIYYIYGVGIVYALFYFLIAPFLAEILYENGRKNYESIGPVGGFGYEADPRLTLYAILNTVGFLLLCFYCIFTIYKVYKIKK